MRTARRFPERLLAWLSWLRLFVALATQLLCSLPIHACSMLQLQWQTRLWVAVFMVLSSVLLW